MIEKTNKKAQIGSETILWFYRFILIIFILLVIVGVVTSHYSKQYDIRKEEAFLLNNKIISCLGNDKGILSSDNFNKENILACTGLEENNEYYTNISLSCYDSNDLDFKDVLIGAKELEVLCKAQEGKTSGKYLPSCLNQKYYVLVDNKRACLDLLVAIAKTEKNV